MSLPTRVWLHQHVTATLVPNVRGLPLRTACFATKPIPVPSAFAIGCRSRSSLASALPSLYLHLCRKVQYVSYYATSKFLGLAGLRNLWSSRESNPSAGTAACGFNSLTKPYLPLDPSDLSVYPILRIGKEASLGVDQLKHSLAHRTSRSVLI